MPDYQKLIDAETWAFIERSDSFYPPEAAGFTVARQREIYDRLCRAFFAGYPEGVTARTGALPARAVPIRTYLAPEPDDAALVLYFHGGGFVVGGLESHDDVCAELCARTGFEVVSVDYRLAPEHVHPAQFDDAMSAFEWAAAEYAGRRVVLCGDSAGGNLAAAVCHATRGHEVKPAGQVLIYPVLGGDMSGGSYVTHAEAPMLTASDVRFYERMRTGGIDRTGDITMAPLADADFAYLPPTVVFTAECDPLASDGRAYCERVLTAGGRAFAFEEAGLVHGYLRARHAVARARSSFTRIVGAVRALGEGAWIW